MKLLVCNGSPRGRTSNTDILLKPFLEGFEEDSQNTHETVYLNSEDGRKQAITSFVQAELILIGFPLYTDAMPGIVKEFIEALVPVKKELKQFRIMFLIHSGFSEGSHTKYIVRYLDKLSRRLGGTYLGTIRTGGTEGIKVQPAFMTQKLLTQLKIMGRLLAQTGKIDETLINKIVQRERFWKIELFFSEIMSEYMFWNPWLKKNGAFEKRFDKPLI
ncbi:MAG: NAD(P)H-dependent oxidoreductase [Candidatus Riflebacteria bacterium]|nr:NAD(P)H-dependent oxidoreductase [Candidatus Riflebacteria bacterium]